MCFFGNWCNRCCDCTNRHDRCGDRHGNERNDGGRDGRGDGLFGRGDDRFGGEIRDGGRGGHGHGHGSPCSPNPHHEDFSRVVATWQTVRHYHVRTHDTIVPVCTSRLGRQNFEGVFGNDGAFNQGRDRD
ncbi:MAG: hypothetical protein FWD86_00990 [Firmicutes bacterium]|nr:hypothetical protein [Bacillota bacterium]